MKRREFIAGLGGAAVLPSELRAQPESKVKRVALIAPGAPVSQLMGHPANIYARTFLHALNGMGYAEGKNLLFQRRFAEFKGPERTAEIAKELIGEGIDVIVVVGTLEAREVMRVTNTVPIVMAGGLDPVARGVVTNLARPGGNVTGSTSQASPDIDGKRLQLLKELVPKLTQVAFLGLKTDWDNPNGEAVRTAAKSLGMTLQFTEHTRTEYGDALARITRDGLEGIFVANQPVSWGKRHLIINFALEHRLPCSYFNRQFVVEGGLMSYASSVTDLFRRAAGYVAKILEGTKPGDLPVEQPTKFELVINLKTANALGLTVPATLLARADEVIE